MSANYYGGVIWTNHALRRMKERGLGQDMALSAFHHPDIEEKGNDADSFRYKKKFEDKEVTIVAKKNERNEWLILSAWIDPPLPGSEDDKRRKAFREYQKASFFKKVLITAARQLGLRRY